MEKAAKDSIRELVLKLRKTLEAEVERELGRYGIYANRKWIPAAELPRLTEQERELDRPRIEAAIHREQDAGLSREEAVVAFVRETAYTHLNRLLGLKCMEMRGLIKETITTRDIYSNRSQRHRDYLDENPQAHREQDRGLVAMLQAAYAEVSQHIGVLFDPDSDYAVVWPRHTTLSDCIGWINALDEQVAGKLGTHTDTMTSVYADDTFLGWVYQYFQEEEKDRVFREVRTKKKKISGYDIIPATSLYTERYMVQFLVENSLGALWMEMYPDSDLCQGWDYFVEDPNLQNENGSRQPGREPKPVAELTMLDPAGGSGHFLLYGFDLFAQMYEAEAQQRGKWADKVQIARDILRHNLYGIDIDLRSIQLSALNLYMKACVYAGVDLAGLRNHAPVQMNLVCADIVLQEGPELEELLQVFSDDPLTQDLIRTLWHGLANARELGSLLNIEEPLNELIERKQAREKGSWFERPQEMWEQWKEDLVKRIKTFADRATHSFDVNKRMLGQEAIKGAQLLDLLTRRFDLVTANPPYMGDRNMGTSLKAQVKKLYPKNSSDLYAASMERFGNLTKSLGSLAMVVQQTMMFTEDFKDLRDFILRNFRIRTVAHLGPGAFEEIGGVKVSVILLTAIATRSQERTGSYFQLVNAEDKGLELRKLCQRPLKGSYFEISQTHFENIAGKPFLYWANEKSISLFQKAQPLSNFADVKTGLSTGNDSRFLRKAWEIPKTAILFPDDEFRNAKWMLHPKGGGYGKYYGNLDTLIFWEDNGAALKESGAAIRNESYYFREGLTYSLVSTTRFSVRKMPKNCVFNFGGSGIFVTDLSRDYLLGLLNTSLINSLLNMLNPTTNYTVGSVGKIPVVVPPKNIERTVVALTLECVRLTKWFLQFDITDLEFNQSAIEKGLDEKTDAQSLEECYLIFQRNKVLNETVLAVAEGMIESVISELYGLDFHAMATIDLNSEVPVAWFPIIHTHYSTLENLVRSLVPTNNFKEVKTIKQEGVIEKIKNDLTELLSLKHTSIKDLSSKLHVNPVSIMLLLEELELWFFDDFINEVENFLSHRIWKVSKQDDDGIIPYDNGISNPSILEQIQEEIENLFGAKLSIDVETEINKIIGRGGLEGWLKNQFFKKHSTQFQKRPILWQITSPQQKFCILIYYHKLDRDTLPKVRSRYLGPLLTRARTELNNLHQHDPDNIKAIGELEEYIADLQDCDQRLESVIQGTVDVELPEWANGPYRHGRPPYDPDLDDGVKVNILPLQEAGLLPIKVV